MNRSTAALIIATLFHLLIIMLFVLLGTMMPEIKKSEPKETHRIKVSLKENLRAAKESLVKNRQKAADAPLPMPKGRQLEKLVEKPLKVEPKITPVKRPPPVTKQPVKRKETPKPTEPVKKIAPLPPKKETYIASKKPIETTKAQKPARTAESEHAKLYSFLSQEAPVMTSDGNEKAKKKRESRINEHIKEAYGDTFGSLTEGEQKYIMDNQEVMRRITQEVLNRVGRVNIPDNFRTNSYNLIEFYLYPNGDISEIKFIKRSGFYILDDTTRETIEYAYSRYPRPQQKTLIRYRVGYYLRGY